MSEFIVTDPTGKEYVVNAPEGATQEQALEYAKTQFGSTPGGAVTGMAAPKAAPQIRKPFGEAIGAIGGAGAFGAAAGAFAPEILSGAAGLATIIPGAQPAVPFLMGAGNVLRGSRGLAAVAGGVSGAAGETAGQAVEMAGGGPVAAEAARFAGGFAPELGIIAANVARRSVGAPVKAVIDWAKIELENKLGRKINQGESIELAKRIEAFRGGSSGKPAMQTVYDALSDEAKRERSNSLFNSEKILRDADSQARQIERDVFSGPVSMYRQTRSEAEKVATQASDAAKASRFSIGRDVDESTIGNELRSEIVKRNAKMREQRSAQYAADEAERNAIVKANESAGITLDTLPEYQALLKDLQGKLLNTRESRDQAKGLAPVTEPGVLRAYQSIYDAVSKRRVQTGVDEAGSPTYETFKTSFDALDDVRRRLGTVFTKQPAEGYEAINAATAKKYYSDISEIQKKFAGGEGGAQERLLDRYASSSDELQQFLSKRGKKITALDRLDPEKYATDARALPNDVFKSRTGVLDAIQLTGNKDLVKQAALDYATSKTANLDSAGVRRWMTTNREMLEVLPDVRGSVEGYANRLERAEGIAKRSQSYISALDDLEKKAVSRAKTDAESLIKSAERNSNKVIQAGERRADLLIGNKEAVEQIRHLVEAGNREAWDIAAPAIKQSQTAQANIIRSVREVLAGRATKTPKDITIFFDDKVRPSLERTGLASTDDLNKIAGELKRLEKIEMADKEKLGLMKRVALQSLTGYASSLAGRGVTALGSGLLSESIPSQ